MRFALVIPALNEEEAIAGTLERALAARARVLAETPVTEMFVVFVNDGSTDRTQEIVDQPQFDEVVKVRFARNRGYGAAIKAGWQTLDADLLGFIDGDGTCDPAFCVQLINRLVQTQADVVLASRLNPDSRMPLIRRIGNWIFARLLGLVSGKSLTDCASGFRVVRRASLKYLTPLPDGLHFTPTLSAICLLDPRLRIEEVPMPYHERLGRSKLSVIKDGFRFLYTILFTACCYTPIKTMMTAAGACTAVSLLLIALMLLLGRPPGVGAALGLVGGLIALQAVYTGVLCHQLNFLLLGPRRRFDAAEEMLQQLLHYRRLIGGGLTVGGAGVAGMVAMALASPGLDVLALLPLAGLVVVGAMMAFGGVVLRVIWAVGEKEKALLAGLHQAPEATPRKPRLRPEPTQVADLALSQSLPTP